MKLVEKVDPHQKERVDDNERARVFKKSHFDEVKQTDKTFYVKLSRTLIITLAIIIFVPILIAWGQFLFFGMPPDVTYPTVANFPMEQAHGFPAWIRLTHFVNFIFLFLLVRSGLSILMDHPRLYSNNHCTPGTEILKFTPVEVPTDRMWTAKDDVRYISPLVALPGGRHTIGVARSWHFISVFIFLLNGIIFVALLFLTNQWERLVPTSWSIIPQSWNVFVHYATFHFPTEPNGFYNYNPLQQLSYFGVTLIMAPLSMLTGIAMSPAVDNRYPWYPKIFGGRQFARFLHFMLLLGYLVFFVIHVSLVVMTGFARNMNHITVGTDNHSNTGLIIGAIGLIIAFAVWIMANYWAWRVPGKIQRIHRLVITPFTYFTMGKLKPSSRYTEKDISPHFWPNGKLPVSEEWLALAANDFKDFKLEIGGLVAHPMTLTLDDLKKMQNDEHITLHHCIQGWSGVAKWGGISMKSIVELVKPTHDSKAVAFYSFGEGLEGGQYYDTQLLENVLKPECILALEMNGQPLKKEFGAPLRLRVENQLGYKMVKWIHRIEFIKSEHELGFGHGGKNEDDEFFDLIPNI